MKFCALASGSSGNCFYIENKDSGILIDAGISSKQIIERLGLISTRPEKIKGIFITHEHSDHVKGADVFVRKFNIPVFATKKTSEKCFLCSNENLINKIKNNETVDIAGMKIETFSKSHNAEDPVSYNIINNKKISIMTDMGYACENVISNVPDANFLCIESNHDLNMLEQGPYPYFLKKWIKSDTGHLSNVQAGLCILEHSSSKLKHVLLAHLSQTNNTPDLALETFKSIVKERKNFPAKINVSLREKPTPLFKIR